MTLFGGFKKKILGYVHSNRQRNQKAPAQLIDFESAKSVGILFEYNNTQDRDFVVGFAEELENSGKEVQIFGYCTRKKDPNFVDPESYAPKIVPQVCFDGDFGLRKFLKNTPLKRFAAYEFDILVDFTPKNFRMIKILVGLSNAKFKTGFYDDTFENRFDLMIREAGGESNAQKLDHLAKYLKIINSPNND